MEENTMKKWIASFVVGGTFAMLEPGGEVLPSAQIPDPPAAMVAMDPCPSCCPPEICSYNGPSLDGTTQPRSVAHSDR